jgi:hypothetical protein
MQTKRFLPELCLTACLGSSRLLNGVFAAGLLLSAVCTRAQNYSIDWHSIDGGGGTSTGGVYSVSGTVGQADAGTMMSGGNYSLSGGFWPGLTVPSSTGGPTLFIQFSGGSVIISWSPATPGFVLEETTSLVSPSWSPAPTGNPTVPIPASGEARFYRLRKP